MERNLITRYREQVIFLLPTEDLQRFSLTGFPTEASTPIANPMLRRQAKLKEIKQLIGQLGLQKTKAILVIGQDGIFQQTLDDLGTCQGHPDVDEYFEETLSRFLLERRVSGLFGDGFSAQNREPLIVCEPEFAQRLLEAIQKRGFHVSLLPTS